MSVQIPHPLLRQAPSLMRSLGGRLGPSQPNRGSFDFRAPKRRFWMVLEPSEVFGLPPASRLRRRPRGRHRHRHALRRLPEPDRAGRSDASGGADDERRTGAATRIPRLVHLERVRPSQPLGAEASHSCVTRCQPPSRTDRRIRRSGHRTVVAAIIMPACAGKQASRLTAACLCVRGKRVGGAFLGAAGCAH